MRKLRIGRSAIAVAAGLATAAMLATPASAFSLTAANTSKSADAKDKLTSTISKKFDAEDKVDFWVKMEAKANLTSAKDMKDWDARGQFVHDQLRSTAKASQAGVIDQLKASGADYKSYWLSNRVLVEDGTEELALKLAASTAVEQIGATHKYELIEPVKTKKTTDESSPASVEWGLDFINAPEAWELGATGEGIVVSSVDSGVDVTHPALAHGYRGLQADGTLDNDYNALDTSGSCGATGDPCDTDGHGTHPMGTMMGDDGAGNQIGVAPDAKWIEANGCDSCSDADLIEAGQWIAAPTRTDGSDPDPTKRPHVVNNSWGYTAAGTIDDWFQEVTASWEAAGIFGAWASGNAGPGCDTTSSPGANTANYSVGAITSTGAIAGFSSRGAGEDGLVKPNIAAPGANVRSSVPGGGYASYNGTSMAAPHVAGAVAALWSAAPSLIGDIEGTKALLNETAVDADDTSCGGTAENNNVFGEGNLDLLALVNAAPIGDMGTVTGTVTDAAGSPIAGAEVLVDGERDRTLTTDASGSYTAQVTVGTYAVSASAFGFLVSAPESVDVALDETETVDITLEAAPGHAVSGTVTDAGSGDPFAGITVTIDAPIDPVRTSAEGTYTFAEVPEGTYTISIAGGSCTTPFSQEVTVDGDETVDAALNSLIDEFGYFCSVGSDGAATGDTEVDLTGDDASAAVTLPFDFSFYGESYDQAWVSTNGALNFLGANSAYSNSTIPSPSVPNAAIYPLWDDQEIDAAAGVYTGTTTVGGVDGFVIEWRGIHALNNDAGTLTTSVTLLANGEVIIGYDDVADDARAKGSSATIGLENTDGTIASQYSYNTAAVSSGLSVRYDTAPMGTVTGTVTDLNTGDPISGATVTLTGDDTERTATTGENGTFSKSVLTGNWTVKASKAKYADESGSVTVADEAEVTFDAALAAGKITVASDGDLSENLRMGELQEETVTVTNEGTAPASVDVSAGGGSFESASTSALKAPEGKATIMRSTTPKGTLGKGSNALKQSGAKSGRTMTPQAAPVPAGEVSITHSASQEIAAANSAACWDQVTTDLNQYLRTFTLSDFGLNGLDVSSISFGVETNTGDQPVTVNLYTLEGALTYANMTLIGSADATVPSGDGQLVSVPVEGSAPAGSTLVVEVVAHAGGRFFIGSNGEGQTAPSYLASEACGITEPVDTSEVGFPDMHIVMNVTGEEGGAAVDWITFDRTSLTLDAGESATVKASVSADVDQPGTYAAEIGGSTDTPYDVEPLAVTMDVAAPRSWGKLVGTVTADGGAGLEGAIVQVNGGKGYRQTLIAEEDGSYVYWIDSKLSPLQLIAAASGHVPETKDVTLRKGKTLQANFSLTPLP
ncbi:MAG: carboxypeptidase regulatory-like domain-containing protein [Nocardioides sp.]|uniref:carboxypeptidase regulatory-like domain-containing protein n=1 Tax=Nocardioides sp. TaxID=35761 RepID=UPI003D6A15FD